MSNYYSKKNDLASEQASCTCDIIHNQHQQSCCGQDQSHDTKQSCCGQESVKDDCGSDGCCCGGDHEHAGEELPSKSFLAGIVLFILSLVLGAFEFQGNSYLQTAGFLIAYLLVGKSVLFTAGKNIAKGEIFDENFLMAIASIGAFTIGEYPEAVAVMLFYQVGEYMQGRAVARSKKSIAQLMDIRPDTANRKTDQGIEEVAAELVRAGDIIVIKPGEKVPLDGEVIQGNSTMDTKALTGESIPQDVMTGSKVLSGSINGQGLLTVRVLKEFSESTVSKIIELVQNASSKKAKTENFITKFARYYTPAVVGIAAALALIPPFVLGLGSFSEWLYRALVFLVISCPCALVISIPLGFFGGIGAASSKGILIKGSNYLEALNSVDAVVFDKTGTLTDGIFRVAKILDSPEFTKEQVLKFAAYAENHSTHPIAVSIQKMFEEKSGNQIDENRISDIRERPGFGIQVQMDGKQILAGNARLMTEAGIAVNEVQEAGSIVYIAVDHAYAGAIVIADEAKKDSKAAVKGLRNLGIGLIAMLTGDSRRIGDKIGKELEIGETYSELLPHQKVEILERLMLENKKKNPSRKPGNVLFVGDGINDAPVLARADIGVAMGGVGSDAAIEAADIVIMNDEPSKIITAIQIARKTRKIVWQNIALALGVKGIVLILGAFGIATMWEAVFADVGVALLAVANSVRAGKIS